MRPRIAFVIALATLSCLSAAVAAEKAAAVAAGLGDPFFPKVGNAGYDVADYDLSLSYTPAKNLLRANETITATATEGLTQYSLDLYNLNVTGVTVDGAEASFRQRGGKVSISPPAVISAGQQFTTVLAYRGKPGPIRDPDKSLEGWFVTPDGAVAFGEPRGTATWAACNNTTLDKATWTFRITVPARLHGVANGRLLGVTRSGGQKQFTWRESQPMTPYLAALDVGRGAVRRSDSAGIPTWTTVDPKVTAATRRLLRRLPAIIRFEQKVFGPYPFDSAGSIVDPAEVGYALETQTRPTYAVEPNLITVVHETAHQWFGDSVGLARWPDIWLNEGFATWAEWYWKERHGGPSARTIFRRLYAIPASRKGLWAPPPGRPGKPKYLFASSIYQRGGMALEALRMKVGTKTFLAILRTWVAQHQYGTARTSQFIALAESVSGLELDPLFQRWLFERGKPHRAPTPGSRGYVLGKWEGTLHQKGMADFRVRADIRSLADARQNTVSYTGIDCGGHWTYLGYEGGAYRFRELISSGSGGSCKGSGRVSLSPVGPDAARYEFHGGGVVSRGTLSRRG